jgi:ATP-dependent protease ClpP protease subunit
VPCPTPASCCISPRAASRVRRAISSAIIKMKRRLNEIYVRHTGQDYATIEKTLERDYFLSAEDALTFGIVDEVISKRHPLDETIQKLMPVA